MPELNKDTRLCMSLSGRPGNFGTRFHNFLYETLGLNFIYKAFSTSDLPGAIAGVRALGIRGCAVSMPFKEAVIPLLDELDASARAIESVNTIVNTDGYLKAFNTDYVAVQQLIQEHGLNASSSVVVRGSGGMGKAVASAFRDAGFQRGTLVARNEQAGRELAGKLGWAWTPEATGAGILVNVTPIGMSGGPEAAELAFSPELIGQADTVFDVVALPPETPLVVEARRQGKLVITGLEVIARQALEQFVLYTGVRPSDEQVEAAVRYAQQG